MHTGSKTRKRMIGVNDLGIRVGEDHHRAKLTDAECDTIVELWEDGMHSYRRLAEMYEVSKATIGHIVTGKRRAQRPTRWKTIEEKI
jgi:hypothetical protein